MGWLTPIRLPSHGGVNPHKTPSVSAPDNMHESLDNDMRCLISHTFFVIFDISITRIKLNTQVQNCWYMYMYKVHVCMHFSILSKLVRYLPHARTDAPRVLIETYPVVIREETTAVCHCAVDANPRSVTYVWSKNGEVLTGTHEPINPLVSYWRILRREGGAAGVHPSPLNFYQLCFCFLSHFV